MDITTTFMVVLTLISLIAGYFLSRVLSTYKYYKIQKAQRKKLKEHIPTIGELDESTTCYAKKDKHDWQNVPIVQMNSEDSSPKETLVCIKCGVMHGTKNQFSEKGLQNLKKQLDMMEERKAFVEELNNFRKEELEKELMALAEANSIPKAEAEKFFYGGIQAAERIAEEQNKKIQEKQESMVKEAFRKLYETDSNI